MLLTFNEDLSLRSRDYLADPAEIAAATAAVANQGKAA
jgi:hypothetical protein